MTDPARRALLTRRNEDGIAGRAGRACVIMLNPSTATDDVDDPTVRKVRWFFRDYTTWCVVNLFDVRATIPEALLSIEYDRLNGPEANKTLRYQVNVADFVLGAWGNGPKSMAGLSLVRKRVTELRTFVDLSGMQCLTVTKAGQPGHPLYLPNSREPFAFPWATFPAGKARP